jgi:hypothetical protein
VIFYRASSYHSRKPRPVTWPHGSEIVITVLDPGKGVCVDPRGVDATLGAGGPGPPMEDSEHQLSLDRGGEKT